MVSSADWSVRGVGDFNSDGKADLVWRNGATFQTVVWLMDGTSYAGEATPPGVSSADWQIEAIGDYNGDLQSDLVWRNSATFHTVVWLLSSEWKVVGPK